MTMLMAVPVRFDDFGMNTVGFEFKDAGFVVINPGDCMMMAHARHIA